VLDRTSLKVECLVDDPHGHGLELGCPAHASVDAVEAVPMVVSQNARRAEGGRPAFPRRMPSVLVAAC